MQIGVLALQGGFAAHRKMLDRLGIPSLEVRTEKELLSCDGLILPGGESTTMAHLIQEEGLHEPLHAYAKNHPLFGTCAGMILMAKEKWMDIAVQRNAYGRQRSSFTTSLELSNGYRVEAVFIRAPQIKGILSNNVEILGMHQGVPVLVKQGFHWAAAFHPELTEDPTLHSLFAEEIRKNLSERQLRR